MENTIDRLPGHASCPDPHHRFYAQVNGKPFLTARLTGLTCLRSELESVQTCKIWKIHAMGKVAYRSTAFGFFIDQSLTPGAYDLARDERLAAVYHLAPKKVAQVYHARDFQEGRLTLLECNLETGRLRGTFEFAISAIGFKVSAGEFDVQCRAHPPFSLR
jgi:hypothetical protein